MMKKYKKHLGNQTKKEYNIRSGYISERRGLYV